METLWAKLAAKLDVPKVCVMLLAQGALSSSSVCGRDASITLQCCWVSWEVEEAFPWHQVNAAPAGQSELWAGSGLHCLETRPQPGSMRPSVTTGSDTLLPVRCGTYRRGVLVSTSRFG